MREKERDQKKGDRGIRPGVGDKGLPLHREKTDLAHRWFIKVKGESPHEEELFKFNLAC